MLIGGFILMAIGGLAVAGLCDAPIEALPMGAMLLAIIAVFGGIVMIIEGLGTERRKNHNGW